MKQILKTLMINYNKMIKLKEQNYWCIKDFATNHNRRPEMQGNKLQALYTLIQKKGEDIKTDDKKFNGIKVLEIAKGEYVGMKRTGGESFYPCVIKTILLTDLN